MVRAGGDVDNLLGLREQEGLLLNEDVLGEPKYAIRRLESVSKCASKQVEEATYAESTPTVDAAVLSEGE